MTDTKQAGEIIGVSAIRVRQFVAEGRLRAEVFNGRLVLDRHEVEAFARVKRETGNPAWKKKRDRS
jgi:predicted site-specific integrase-resolvase